MLPCVLLVLGWVDGTAAAQALPTSLPCEPNAGLQEVAKVLSQSSVEPSRRALTDALAAAHIGLPSVYALHMPGLDVPRAQSFLADVKSRDAAPVLCGLVETSAAALLLAAPAMADLRIVTGSHPAAEFALAPAYHDPWLVVMNSEFEFQVQRVPQAERARVPLSIDVAAGALVQLMASGPHGPRPLALAYVGAGVRAPMHVSDGTLGAPFHGMVTRLRRIQGRPPIRPNRLLREAARRHARAVCRAGKAAHVIAGVGPQERLRRQGIAARSVGETVARAESLAAAYNILLASPSHLMTLLQRDFSDAGVGSARSAGGTCLVILLATYPQYSGRPPPR